MPKDPTRNIDRYKIRGGQLNAFEFARNQAAIAQEQHERWMPREEMLPWPEAGSEPSQPTEALARPPSAARSPASAQEGHLGIQEGRSWPTWCALPAE